jgi:hypothetical protein
MTRKIALRAGWATHAIGRRIFADREACGNGRPGSEWEAHLCEYAPPISHMGCNYGRPSWASIFLNITMQLGGAVEVETLNGHAHVTNICGMRERNLCV